MNGCICYIFVSSRSDAVISWAARLLPQSLFVIYEQIRPCDPFGQIMNDHFLKRNTRLHGLQNYPDAAAQKHRFLDKVSIQTVCFADKNVIYTLVMDTHGICNRCLHLNKIVRKHTQSYTQSLLKYYCYTNV